MDTEAYKIDVPENPYNNKIISAQVALQDETLRIAREHHLTYPEFCHVLCVLAEKASEHVNVSKEII
jgi:hypothetical protein